MRLIACGSKKRSEPVIASDLYIGSLFNLAKAWASESPDGKWGILSAKHGLIKPWEIYAPYDFTFKKAPNEWVEQVIATIPADVSMLEIAAPMRYADPIVERHSRAIPVLRGVGGIGCQMKWLKDNTNNASSKH